LLYDAVVPKGIKERVSRFIIGVSLPKLAKILS
jgi:hypothetical protein